ncbi:hypothetical protein K1719_045928, partial [Acacia pycnantha]
FHEFLKLENEIGNITRQEAVSMVPPLFLDVHSNHFVLDMCAAPGSKTFQLLDIIHQSCKVGSLPDGMVMANDLDVQRCNLLIHQAKRMCTANLIVTNHEAQHFPGCRLNRKHDTMDSDQHISQLLFDRVLCDVPCSGDGTLRKAPDLWRKWNTGMGHGLHSLQVLIALRGASLLKVGGRMVYSTCSMNPIENEAVVAEILRRCGGSVELVDVSHELPQLIRGQVSGDGRYLTRAHGWALIKMFPSMQNDINDGDSDDGLQATENSMTNDSTEEVSNFPLERCMRIVPHDQNTGAFFIAVLQKVSPLPAIQEKPKKGISKKHVKPANLDIEDKEVLQVDSLENTTKEVLEAVSVADLNEIESNIVDLEVTPSVSREEWNSGDEARVTENAETIARMTQGKSKMQIQGKWRGVDPVIFFKDDVIMNSIKAFYGIDEQFPINGHLISRNNDPNHVKRIYYVSKSVKDVLGLNFSVGQQLKIASIGLKMFERQSSREGSSAPCSFRITSEGLPVILPYITKQILHASPVDFKRLLQNRAVRFADFVDTEFGEKAANLKLGCCVVVLGKGNRADLESFQVDESTIAIGCWKGRASLTVMVTETDCQELLERLLVRLDAEHGSSVLVDKQSNNVGEEGEGFKGKTTVTNESS